MFSNRFTDFIDRLISFVLEIMPMTLHVMNLPTLMALV